MYLHEHFIKTFVYVIISVVPRPNLLHVLCGLV